MPSYHDRMQNMAEHFEEAMESHKEEIEKAIQSHLDEISEAQRKLEYEQYKAMVKKHVEDENI